MQPQQRNLVLFLVLSLVTFLVWSPIHRRLFPPPPRPEPRPAEATAEKVPLPDKRLWGGLPGQAVPGIGGLADAVRLAGDAAVAQQHAGGKRAPEAVAKAPEPPRPPRRVEGQPKTVTLGDEQSNLLVELQSEGAAVRRLVLNKFQEANALGQPMWLDDAKRVPKPLELLPPPGAGALPSNVLFHYDPRRKTDERPLETLARDEWRLTGQGKRDVEGAMEHFAAFTTDVPGSELELTKEYSLRPGAYHVGLEVKVRRKAGGEGKTEFRYQLASGHRLPVEGAWYTPVQVSAVMGRVDPRGDLERSLDDSRRIAFRQGGDAVERKDDRTIQYAGVMTQYFASLVVVEPASGRPPDILAHARATLESTLTRGRVTSVTPEKREFVVAGEDRTEYRFVLGPGLTLEDPLLTRGAEVGVVWNYDGQDRRIAQDVRAGDDRYTLALDDIMARVVTEPVTLAPGEEKVHKYLLYNGPVKPRLLGQLEGDKEVPAALVDYYLHELHLKTLTDYPMPNWFGNVSSTIGWTKVLVAVTNLMHSLLWYLHQVVPNYGLCIIILTLLVRGMMFPLSRKMALNSQRMSAKMQELAPEFRRLEDKYKGDRVALQQAKSELMLRRGAHPLAMMGSCWIVFLQMPIFMGLYYALQESIHFRLAPFLWVDNLAAPDMLVRWGESIPWLSRPQDYGWMLYLGPYFNILPVISCGLMIYTQSKIMAQQPIPPDPEQALQLRMQQKMMKYMMLFFGILFYKVAAGLCLYFIVSSLWGIMERRMLPKKPDAGTPPSPEPARAPQPGLLSRLAERAEELRRGTATAQPEPRGRRKRSRTGAVPTGATPTPAPDGSFLGRLRAAWAEILRQAEKR